MNRSICFGLLPLLAVRLGNISSIANENTIDMGWKYVIERPTRQWMNENFDDSAWKAAKVLYQLHQPLYP